MDDFFYVEKIFFILLKKLISISLAIFPEKLKSSDKIFSENPIFR